MTCTATAASGRRCRRSATAGREVCHSHSGENVGRPSALTPAVHERIVRAKGVGATDWAAAQMAGISETTYYELLKRGRAEQSGPHRDLAEAIERAEAEHYVYALATWRQGMRDDWRAGMAYTARVDRRRTRADRSAGERPVDSEERRVDPRSLPDDILAFFEDHPAAEGDR